MKKYLFFSVFIALIASLYAQPATPDSLITKIELKDGSTLIGTFVSEDSLGVDFRTLSGMTARIAHTHKSDIYFHILLLRSHQRTLYNERQSLIRTELGYF